MESKDGRTAAGAHGFGRRRAAESFEVLLDTHPQIAGHAARALAIWQQRALVDRLARIAGEDLLGDPGSAFAVDYSLSMALQYATAR